MNRESEQLNFIIGLLMAILFFVAGGRIEHLFQSLFHAALWLLAAYVAFRLVRGSVRGLIGFVVDGAPKTVSETIKEGLGTIAGAAIPLGIVLVLNWIYDTDLFRAAFIGLWGIIAVPAALQMIARLARLVFINNLQRPAGE